MPPTARPIPGPAACSEANSPQAACAPPRDFAAIRRQFPVVAREAYAGVPLVYLDSAATSLKPVCVIEALAEHYRSRSANVHRGLHRLAEEATEAYEQARERLARFIHAPAARQVIFTHGATESINLVAHSWGRTNLGPGAEVVVTEMEHHANLVPWQQAAAQTGATLRSAPITDDGQLDLAALDRLLTPRVKLVAVTACSNVLGTVNPIAKIANMAHAVGAVVMVDAAQHVSHRPTDVTAWDCDFLAFSSHKMCGPEGVGVLYGKAELLEAMPPFLTGGEMVRRVRPNDADWNELPWKFEAGTPPIAPAIALGVAVDFIESVGFEAIVRHETELLDHASRRLSALPSLRILGPAPQHRSGLIAFTLDDIHPHDVAQLLDRRGIAIRAGHHCAQPLHTQLGIAASARASFYLYNTTDEVDRLADGIRYAQELLSPGAPRSTRSTVQRFASST
jgi:cysteine desulfurase/selenocysteine lyase